MIMTPEPYDNPQPIREISFVKRLCPLLWFSFGPIPGDSWSLLWSVYTYSWRQSLRGKFLNVTPLMLVWPRLLPSWNHFESPVIFWIHIDIYTGTDYFVKQCQSKLVVRLPESAITHLWQFTRLLVGIKPSLATLPWVPRPAPVPLET